MNLSAGHHHKYALSDEHAKFAHAQVARRTALWDGVRQRIAQELTNQREVNFAAICAPLSELR